MKNNFSSHARTNIADMWANYDQEKQSSQDPVSFYGHKLECLLEKNQKVFVMKISNSQAILNENCV